MILRLRNQPLWVEITFLTVIKLCALYTLWHLCFSPPHKIDHSSERTAEHILLTKEEHHA